MLCYIGIYYYRGIPLVADELINLESLHLHHLQPCSFPSDRIDAVSRIVTSFALGTS
uniref:Uncharacterized protein n=1 Tax=Lepeophtheirus salmonis TaxID=72036 RepID=A0A0K2VBD4_LEPSM